MCSESYPLIDGISRLLREPHRARFVAQKTAWFSRNAGRASLARHWSGDTTTDHVVEGFDYEWSQFARIGTDELGRIFSMYFDLIPLARYDGDVTVLDAGCGAGRWAAEVAARGPRVIALDLGASIEVARKNLDRERVGCVQADILDCPIRADSIDWAYSLGVLHHTSSPDRGLKQVAATVKAGGVVLLYLYYALDSRGPAFYMIFRIVDLVRRVTSRLPRRLVHLFAGLVAIAIYWPAARASKCLHRLGFRRLASLLPLSGYSDRSLSVMMNDSLDRFGTRVEKRYRRAEIIDLMHSAGLAAAIVSDRPPYWHAAGRKSVEL